MVHIYINENVFLKATAHRTAQCTYPGLPTE